ncbi:hypothetical protein [Streptomyces virginiae]|uniref:Aminoglycoside phosphotransferase n=1 Tax=Streptomyces virginiae TaxID=1961 RepID=A0ABZ1TR92_STRVG|nr:hypothetical protein [Streptomyces virginiae]
MYSPPDDPTRERMQAAHAEALHRLGLHTSGPYAWGWNARTISSLASTDHWLRIEATPDDRAAARELDEGISGAENLPDAVPRPRLHATTTWTKDAWTYTADLLTHIPHPVISPHTPELRADPGLDDRWWTELRGALDALATVPTGRETVRTLWMRRTFPLFLGVDAPDRIERETGHGDLHWANLTGTPLTVMDWERWGSVPAGFDAGLLHAYSQRVPAVAARVRAEFAHVLDTPTGRIGELAALCEMLQSVARGEYTEIAPALMHRAEALTGRRLPVPPQR